MDTGQIASLLAALGTGAILLKLFEGVFQWVTGRSKREHSAWSERDREARVRRLLEEYVHALRILLRVKGVPEEEIPPWPRYGTKSKEE